MTSSASASGLDFLNSIAHIGLLRWLQRGGVSRDDVDITTSPFPQLLGPLTRGDDRRRVASRALRDARDTTGSEALRHALRRHLLRGLPADAYMARASVDPNLAARFRNAVRPLPCGQTKSATSRRAARILARYTSVDAKVIAKTARFSYATRLRVRMAQPFLDLYAEYDLIPDSFQAIDLVK